MIGEWIRFFVVAGLLILGMFFEVMAVFGVNRFKKALNRMHAAAMGDTLGILFIFLGLMVMRGVSMDSLKLLLVILFFWLASPVSGHMISRLEAMTNPNLGELTIIRLDEGQEQEKEEGQEQEKEERQESPEDKSAAGAKENGGGKEKSEAGKSGAGPSKPGNANAGSAGKSEAGPSKPGNANAGSARKNAKGKRKEKRR